MPPLHRAAIMMHVVSKIQFTQKLHQYCCSNVDNLQADLCNRGAMNVRMSAANLHK